MQQILLVEDDPEIANLIGLHLDSNLYQLIHCRSGRNAMNIFEKQDFDLVILDIELPDINGTALCKQIRAADSFTPVLMLTCHSEEADKVLALEMGADDYVTKPFGILELLARIKAIIRRTHLPALKLQDLIIYQELSIDTLKRKVMLKGHRLELTVKEFDLLVLLASNPGKSFSRKELLENVWGFSFSGYEHTVTSHINRLRIKIENSLNDPRYILTAWGTGYRFAE